MIEARNCLLFVICLALTRLLAVDGFSARKQGASTRHQVNWAINRRRPALRSRPETRMRLLDSSRDTGSKKAKVDDDFWLKQKKLIEEMSNVADRAVRQEQREQFAKRRLALVSDTAYFGFFIFCALWIAFDNPFVALSNAVGTLMGMAYAFGLGKYVENLGGEKTGDLESVKGSGVGEARFAFLILLFIVVGKFRSAGLEVVPTIAGFFTYQLASLSQGLRQEADE